VRVFVAGATGAIGRPLVPKLLAAGHEVIAMTRSEEAAGQLRDAGAEAVVCDVFDRDGVRDAMARARPEAVVHQLTALPWRIDPRKRSSYEATNRIRTEGTRVLVEAARAGGARRMVAQSLAFTYAPEGDWVKEEDAPLVEGLRGPLGEAMAADQELERTVLGADGLEGVVLRYGFFYGPGTPYAADGWVAHDVRRRRLPVVGDGRATYSLIHVDDAADATVAALERGAPGVYNVVDDDPAPMRDWVPAYAEALGAKPPRRIPAFLARLVGGKGLALMATGMRGASNAKAKRELGWSPAHPSWRQGLPESLR
jgi:nucleoside-diphosphate-sugar epimerase